MKKTRRDVLVVGLTGGWSGRIVGLVLGCNCIRNLLCICNLRNIYFTVIKAAFWKLLLTYVGAT